MFGRSLAALVVWSLPLAVEAETLLVANKREATLTFLDPGTGIVRAASILDLETLERVGVLIVGYGVDGLAYSGL